MSSYHNPYEHGYNQHSLNIQYGNGQSIGGHDGSQPDPQGAQDHLEMLLSVGNSHIWYVALIPLFGLLFEIFADSKYLGAFLWGLIIVIRILVCRHDNKKLIDMGLWHSQNISGAVFFPVIYIFKRSRLLGRSVAPSLVAIVCLYFAIIGNGFAEAATYNESNYYTLVSEYSASAINNLPKDENYIYNSDTPIGGLLNQYCLTRSDDVSKDSLVSYEYENRSGKHYVTATGGKSGEELSIVFLLDYDGYYYNGMDIEQVSLDGNILEDEQKDNILKEIFMLELTD